MISVAKYEGNLAAGTIYATNHLIASDPDALRRFLAAWLETVGFIATHKAETGQASRVQVHRLLSRVVMAQNIDRSTNGMFSKDCKFDAQSLANLERSFIDLKLLVTPPDMTKFYTEAFVPK